MLLFTRRPMFLCIHQYLRISYHNIRQITKYTNLSPLLPPGWASELCHTLLVSWMDPVHVHCSLSPAYLWLCLLDGLWTHVVALSMALSPFAPDSLFGSWIWFIASLVWDC